MPEYKLYKSLNLPEIGQDILQKWESENAFEKSVTEKEGKPTFVFYEGPPSANGLPGIHHVISRTLKDLVCRYKTMAGYQVHRKGGWDTHGLPIELGVEKELGITKADIGKKISVEEYNKKCREVVLRYKDIWDDITRKMGYWVDLDNPYITYENDYIESLWWLIKKLYDKGYLYQSISIQPYSPAAGTGLSSHELNQPGTYKDVKDTSATVMFKLLRTSNNESKNLVLNKLFSEVDKAIATTDNVQTDVSVLAWTTTPWTLPSNLGLTVGANIDYVLVQTVNPYTHQLIFVILAKELLHKYFKSEYQDAPFEAYKNDGKNVPYKILLTIKGSELEGLQYEQLLPFTANALEKIEEITPNAQPFKIVLGDFVTTEDGTGIVHTAPAFGADDFKVGKANNLGILNLVDREGKFIDGVGEFSGRYVKDYKNEANYVDVNVDIAVKLKLEGKAFKVEKYEHNYPHCWRTDKPILYYPLNAWFIKTTAVQQKMIKANNIINWKPESTGTGRFGNWLENIQDWNLSRSRFWGTPLPIWKTNDEENPETKCIGSVAELKAEIEKSIAAGVMDKNPFGDNYQNIDLHKPYVDNIILVSPSGKPMTRVPDLIDVWFDSGAMPYAQYHFPFENKELFAKNFPADFIAEGVDQTRGWFYTLHAIAILLQEEIEAEINKKVNHPQSAYKTVVSNGLVLDKNGNKMSKRLGNVVDPFKTIDNYGADATRWYLVTNASPWDNLKFDEEGIKEVQRKFFGTLFNTYQFFAIYAKLDKFTYSENDIDVKERPEMDQWILSCLNTLIKNATQAYDNYEPTQAGRLIEEFTDVALSNWYVRLGRRRFWKGEYETDKISAYQTLYTCMITIAKLMAPIAPFFSDWLYRNLNEVTQKEKHNNIHLCDFPVCNESYIQKHLEDRMELTQNACSLILSIRKKVNLKVRQPLQKVSIPALNKEMANQISEAAEIIKAETNIKEVEILDSGNNLIKKRAKANFKSLGKKLGSKMKWAADEIARFNDAQIDEVVTKGYNLNDGNENYFITNEDIEVLTDDLPGYEIASQGSLTVALDIKLNPELIAEGYAREFVNKVQNIRKDANFELTDRIIVKLSQNDTLKIAFNQFKDYICGEILADELDFVDDIDSQSVNTDINGENISLFVTKTKE